MRCPACRAPVTRKDRISRLSWTGLWCSHCKAELESTKVSIILVFVVSALVRVGVRAALRALGMGGVVGLGAGAASFLVSAYLGLGSFSRLKVGACGQPSLSS
jgi:hypothetical protein